MTFSERKGYKIVSTAIQTEGMSSDLRISLWNVLDLCIWQREGFRWRRNDPATNNARNGEYVDFSAALWFEFFKRPLDERPDSVDRVVKKIRDHFFAATWNEVYDFLEWLLNHEKSGGLIEAINHVLARELAGYRFVREVFTDITGEQEVKLLEEALADDKFKGVQAHLTTALQHLSNRRNPDYRNSIKESISAVESIAKVISGKPKSTLSDALAALEKQGCLHGALKSGFSSLYGYTSDEGGIRHAMLDEPNLTAHDAKFFLLSCTSFINYLKTKV